MLHYLPKPPPQRGSRTRGPEGPRAPSGKRFRRPRVQRADPRGKTTWTECRGPPVTEKFFLPGIPQRGYPSQLPGLQGTVTGWPGHFDPPRGCQSRSGIQRISSTISETQAHLLSDSTSWTPGTDDGLRPWGQAPSQAGPLGGPLLPGLSPKDTHTCPVIGGFSLRGFSSYDDPEGALATTTGPPPGGLWGNLGIRGYPPYVHLNQLTTPVASCVRLTSTALRGV